METNETVTSQTPPTTSAPAQAAPAAEPQGDNGRNVILPSRAFKARLEQARKSGQAEATASLDKIAQAKGFASHAAMMAHLDTILAAPRTPAPKPQAAAAGPTTPAKPTPPANRNDSRAMARYQQELDRWKRDNEKLSKQLADEQKRRRNAERKADAQEAKANLERIANRQGIQDTEYAIHLFNQHHAGMSVEDLEKVDELQFFQGLRAKHGYLFGERVVPATTGTAGGVPGANAMSPGQVSTTAASTGKVDVRKMTKQQYTEYMRARGLDINSVGLS